MKNKALESGRMSYDIILFAARVIVGFSMICNGYPKLQLLLSGGEIKFFDFMGMGGQISLALTVFAEFFCSIALILGFYTRISLGFLLFTMFIAAFVVHGADSFEKKELALIYLSVYLLLMGTGSGKISIDFIIGNAKLMETWASN